MKHLPNDHVENPIQHKNKLCSDYFKSYKVHQILTAFILLCMILVETNYLFVILKCLACITKYKN